MEVIQRPKAKFRSWNGENLHAVSILVWKFQRRCGRRGPEAGLEEGARCVWVQRVYDRRKLADVLDDIQVLVWTGAADAQKL